MASIECPKCQGEKRNELMEVSCQGRLTVRGTITCDVCNHEFPFTMHAGQYAPGSFRALDTALPGTRSDKLRSSVPADIRDDVKEAERANYAQCYKACVTMCRRALQLSLIDKGIADRPLSKMLEEADTGHMFTASAYSLGKSIKLFGDTGAHRTEKIDPEKATLAIYATVEMLNEMFS